MFAHDRLEIHAAHACNLTCESCSHFSNGGHKAILSPEDAEEWMKLWNTRIEPKTFRILGGEPTLNPNLTELIYLTRPCWPSSKITLVTNGLLLNILQSSRWLWKRAMWTYQYQYMGIRLNTIEGQGKLATAPIMAGSIQIFRCVL